VCCTIRHAVLTGDIDVRIGLGHLTPDRRRIWEGHLAQAGAAEPADFQNNGFVVAALQGAWSAIHNTAGRGTLAEAVCSRVGTVGPTSTA
jgi:ADP-ribosyl-[dinitrogen reductase] hydrolase